MRKLSTTLIFAFLLIEICFGQIDSSPKGILSKETKYYPGKPESLQETNYKYAEGKLILILNYSNTVLSGYQELYYNAIGNEIKRVYYDNNGEIQHFILTTYDAKQRLQSKRKIDINDKVEYLYEYDTINRLIFEKYPTVYEDLAEVCYYNKYIYSNNKLIEKSFYMDCNLKVLEVNLYDRTNKKTKTEIYTNGYLTKFVVYKYSGNLLIEELTFDSSNKSRPQNEICYKYENNSLSEILDNGKIVQKNYYIDNLLIKRENYIYDMVSRPPDRLGLSIIEYEYY